jgi:hypothetical protein
MSLPQGFLLRKRRGRANWRMGETMPLFGGARLPNYEIIFATSMPRPVSRFAGPISLPSRELVQRSFSAWVCFHRLP